MRVSTMLLGLSTWTEEGHWERLMLSEQKRAQLDALEKLHHVLFFRTGWADASHR